MPARAAALRRIARQVAPRAAVLVYHRIGTPGFDPFGQAVAPEHFARHLEYLRRHHHVVSVPELLERLPRRTFPDGTFAVTFDDGYADNLTAAYPIAREAGVPMTVFVTVEPVFKGERFWWDELAALTEALPLSAEGIIVEGAGRFPFRNEDDRKAARDALQRALKRMTTEARTSALEALRAQARYAVPDEQGRPLSLDELRELAAQPGVTIGAHTMTHPTLAALPTATQLHELAESRRQLAQHLGRPVTLLAYPFGKATDISRQTPRLAARAGYQAAFSTTPRRLPLLPRRYALPRLSVHDWDEADFARRIQALLGEPT